MFWRYRRVFWGFWGIRKIWKIWRGVKGYGGFIKYLRGFGDFLKVFEGFLGERGGGLRDLGDKRGFRGCGRLGVFF